MTEVQHNTQGLAPKFDQLWLEGEQGQKILYDPGAVPGGIWGRLIMISAMIHPLNIEHVPVFAAHENLHCNMVNYGNMWILTQY